MNAPDYLDPAIGLPLALSLWVVLLAPVVSKVMKRYRGALAARKIKGSSELV